jgi:hypothetical protein
LLTEEIDIPFPAITLDVMCDGPATAADLANVGAQTAKFCAIAKMFVAAGTNLNVNWTKAET